MKLTLLAPGQKARISRIETTPELEAKLREVGFAEGDEVELLARGPLGAPTLAVRLNRSIVALRGTEAASILVDGVTAVSATPLPVPGAGPMLVDEAAS